MVGASPAPSCSSLNDCANGIFPTGDNNFIGQIGPEDGCDDFVNGVKGDQVGTPETPIDPLLVGSPAIDRGNPEGCQAVDVANFIETDTAIFNDLTADQRGFARPVAILDPEAPICDIGAYELEATEPSPSASPSPPPLRGFIEGSGCSLNPASTPIATILSGMALSLMAGLLAWRKNRD